MKPSLQENLVQNSSFIFLLSNFVLFIFWSIFAIRHVQVLNNNPKAYYIIVFIISEMIIALLFLFRKKQKDISQKKIDWLLPLAGTFLPLLFIPGGKITNLNWGINLMTTGVIIQIISALSLNRSLGIIPANRELKTSGAYKIIRHPMYFSYFFTYSGYLLVSFSLFNFYLYIFTIFSLFLRIHMEENFLKKIPEFIAYSKKTKYRLIPFIY